MEKIIDKIVDHIWQLLVGYAIFAVIIAALLKTVFMLSYIPSGSMESTLMTGDVIISSRYDVEAEDIDRYDILIFESDDTLYIKRAIGLPGETIEVKDGKVFADGMELDNSFTNGRQNGNGDGVWTVPEGCLFFLGDNRNNSMDSRFWEQAYVPIENVQAKAKITVFPFTRFGSVACGG